MPRTEVRLATRTGHDVHAAALALCERGDRAHALVLDVTDTAAVSSAVAAHGPFQVLVNNAGSNRHKPFNEVTEDDVDTPTTRDWLATPDLCAQALSKIALRGVGRVEDVMGALLFLAGAAAALVTGAALMVDGGWTAA